MRLSFNYRGVTPTTHKDRVLNSTAVGIMAHWSATSETDVPVLKDRALYYEALRFPCAEHASSTAFAVFLPIDLGKNTLAPDASAT